MLRTAEVQLRRQQAIAGTTAAVLGRLWRRLGSDFSAEWAQVRPQGVEALQAGRSAAVASAVGYVDAVLGETGQVAAPVGELAPARFLAATPDGRDVGALLDQPVIRARAAVAGGATVQQALAQAGTLLTAISLTALADTRRAVYQADIGMRPTLTGYVRMLNPPSCTRCVILAGKWFRWNEGFQRHPRCDCQHIPASENVGGDLRTDPYEYFKGLNGAEQDRLFGKNDAQAIRDGADIYRVANVRRRGLATASGARRYGTPHRLTVDDIYRVAGSRERAIALMRAEGFIRERGQVAVAFSPGVRTDAQILAAGRGRGTVAIGGRTVATKRAQRFDAARTGARDPLSRATMTAAERRLYDAAYRLEYARIHGHIPRSVGLNSADVASGARGVPVTPERLDELRDALDRQIARIKPGSSLERLYRALDLDEDGATIARIVSGL